MSINTLRGHPHKCWTYSSLWCHKELSALFLWGLTLSTSIWVSFPSSLKLNFQIRNEEILDLLKMFQVWPKGIKEISLALAIFLLLPSSLEKQHWLRFNSAFSSECSPSFSLIPFFVPQLLKRLPDAWFSCMLCHTDLCLLRIIKLTGKFSFPVVLVTVGPALC